MTDLWRRRWRVEVGSAIAGGSEAQVLDVSELDVEFDVKKDLTRQPNKATVKVWNLSREHRAAVASACASGAAFVRVWAGYVDPGPVLLFTGRVSKLKSEVADTSIATVFEAKDGGAALRSARIQRSFAPGTSVEAVTRALAAELGIGEGNLSLYAPGLRLLTGETTFRSGYVVAGPVGAALDDLLRGADLRWSVLDGALLLRPRGGAASEQAVLLSPSTGLVGSPQPEDKGLVSVTALLQPSLLPGAKVSLESREFSGGYLVREVAYKGQTSGQAWHAVMRLAPY